MNELATFTDKLDSNLVQNADGVWCMSSLAIAEITGKEHRNVLRDIKDMLDELEIGALKFEGTYLDVQNKQRPMYNLPKRECMILVSGYDTKLRASIIDRWQQLEDAAAAAAAPAPTINLQADTKLEFLLNSVRLAYESMELAKAVSQKLAIGDYSTWNQLRNANQQCWYMQECNAAWIPAALSKKAKTDGVHIHQYGTDGANSQFQGRAYPTDWLVQTVTKLLKDRYGFNGELQAPLREEIRPVLAEQILVQADYMQANLLGVH